MLIRYSTSQSGKRTKLAEIYTQDEHRIDLGKIDRDAVKVTEKLNAAGFEAYIVGGAVRDLLIGKKPKDFDIATNALPRQIKKVFRNSRIIGKRFKLVHIYFYDKNIEVSTFRSNNPGQSNNIYGVLEDDVKRRDFTFNALYYSTKDRYIVDYVKGFQDISSKTVRSIIPIERTFSEDPVRLIRSIKYSVTTNFTLPLKLRKGIKKYAPEIARCSSSRLTEEMFKILQSGYSEKIFLLFWKYELFKYILPAVYSNINKNRKDRDNLFSSFIKLDMLVMKKGNIERSKALLFLIESFICIPEKENNTAVVFSEIFAQVKDIIIPLTPPNALIKQAINSYMKKRGFSLPRKPIRKKKTAVSIVNK